MKKETTVIAQIELTKIHKGDEPIPTARELESAYSQMLNAHTYDDAHIKVKIFEAEKEEISTEDLIAAYRHCISYENCSECRIDNSCIGVSELERMVVDRLEELYNQQTATPTEQERNRTCDSCKYESFDPSENPCLNCDGNCSKWEAKKW